jgi:dsRNA-specific ribonuclease
VEFLNYPKRLADAFEALFGAVYVDSEFDINVVDSVFRRILLPMLQRYISMERFCSFSEVQLVMS